MRSYKIESYVPEENFLRGKDARFCRAAFEDCFVVDIHKGIHVIASARGEKNLEVSMADAANLLTWERGKKEILILSSSHGTLLFYPAWQSLGLALAFFLPESPEEVEKAYQNAKRYAFSMVFNNEADEENNQNQQLETKLCVLDFYINSLFGDKRETNIPAQILMLANLIGCRLHETTVSRMNINFDEREAEKISAFLCCVFMTMRRYNGRISTYDETADNSLNSTHVPQEYGISIQQSINKRITKTTPFGIPNQADVAGFATHPAFSDYRIEEVDGAIRMHLPVKQKAVLSSVSVRGREQEITLTLFPF